VITKISQKQAIRLTLEMMYNSIRQKQKQNMKKYLRWYFNFRYIHAIQGAFLALPFFIIASIFIPGGTARDEVKVILTIATFLFAIIAGFFISRLATRYNEIRRLIATADADLLNLYKISRNFGKKFEKKMTSLIDEYLIITYDSPLAKSHQGYKTASVPFFQMWEEVNALTLEQKRKIETSKLYDILMRLEQNRNNASGVASEKLNPGQWIMISLLASIVIFCIYYLKVDAFYFQLITVLLGTILILVLLLMRDLQHLMLGGKELLEESGQEVFEFMGEKRYVHIDSLKKGTSKAVDEVKEFRVGMHLPGSKFNIKIVKQK
jgi:hypothetical protein